MLENVFASLQAAPPDVIIGISDRFHRDPRSGIYLLAGLMAASFTFGYMTLAYYLLHRKEN